MKDKKEVYYREPRWLYIIAVLLMVISLTSISIVDDIFMMIGFLLIAIIQNETKPKRHKTREK